MLVYNHFNGDHAIKTRAAVSLVYDLERMFINILLFRVLAGLYDFCLCCARVYEQNICFMSN